MKSDNDLISVSLGISSFDDWMTKRLEDIRLPYRHFERSEKSLSFAAQWSMCGNPKWEACHQETFGHRHYLYAAELLLFMRRTTPVGPVEPAPLLLQTIKGQHVPRANPEP